MGKQVLKMRVVDWWEPDNEENFYKNYIVNLLSKKYDIEYSDNPDFLIYGPFGHEHVRYDCVRIFYTGENVRPDYNLTDYAISFDYAVFEDRHIHAPLIFFNNYRSKDLQNTLKTRLHLAKDKTKFCGFVVSNSSPFTEMRDSFFEALCDYKMVDSGGRHKNNIGGNIRRDSGVCDKIEWLKSYKFNICFENGSYPGYLTEKLFDAFMAGCVPIYWGDTSLRCKKNDNVAQTTPNFTANPTIALSKDSDTMGGGGVTLIDTCIDTRIPNIPPYLIDYEINPKAFINAHNFPTFKDLIEEIKRIDNDDKAFLDMLKEPIFLNDFDPQSFYSEKVFQFLDYIVKQGPECARRRGSSPYLQTKENLLNSNQWSDNAYLRFIEYCVKHRKLIESIRKTSEYPRNLLRLIRGK